MAQSLLTFLLLTFTQSCKPKITLPEVMKQISRRLTRILHINRKNIKRIQKQSAFLRMNLRQN
jgi:hypothetical protein